MKAPERGTGKTNMTWSAWRVAGSSFVSRRPEKAGPFMPPAPETSSLQHPPKEKQRLLPHAVTLC